MNEISINFNDYQSYEAINDKIRDIVQQKSNVEVLHILGATRDEVQNHTSTLHFQHFLEQLASNMTVSFDYLYQIEFIGESIQIDELEAELIARTIRQLLATSPSFQYVGFYQNQLTTQGFSCLTSLCKTVAGDAESSGNEYSNAVAKPLEIEIEDCQWNPFPYITISGCCDSVGYRCVVLEVRDIQMSLSVARLLVNAFCKLQEEAKVRIEKVHFFSITMSVEAFQYLQIRSNNWNQTTTVAAFINQKTSLELSINDCRFYKENGPTSNRPSRHGTLSGYDKKWEFNGFRADQTAKVELLAFMIQQIMNICGIDSLCFCNCKLSEPKLSQLLSPILNQDDNDTTHIIQVPYVAFKKCIFFSNSTIYPTTQFIEWSDGGHSITVADQAQVEGHSIHTVVQLLTTNPTFHQVTTLDLCGSGMTDSDVHIVSQNLKHTQVKSIYLSSEHITDLGLQYLMGAMTMPSTKTSVSSSGTVLDSLYIRQRTCITNNGLKKFLEVLVLQITTFHDLRLEDESKYDPELVKQITFVASLNKMINRGELLKNTDGNQLSISVFPKVVQKAKNDPSIIFWILQMYPQLCITSL